MRLLLLRHAKSDWSAGKSADDHQRALNARGRRSAARMGVYLRERHYLPDLVLCSTALRTRETVDLLFPDAGPRPEIRYSRGLYLADPAALLRAVRGVPSVFTTLLLVGHNPGLERLAVTLARRPADVAERERGARLREKFPTAAVVVLAFPGSDWADVAPGRGRIIDYARPKDLSAEDELG